MEVMYINNSDKTQDTTQISYSSVSHPRKPGSQHTVLKLCRNPGVWGWWEPAPSMHKWIQACTNHGLVSQMSLHWLWVPILGGCGWIYHYYYWNSCIVQEYQFQFQCTLEYFPGYRICSFQYQFNSLGSIQPCCHHDMVLETIQTHKQSLSN